MKITLEKLLKLLFFVALASFLSSCGKEMQETPVAKMQTASELTLIAWSEYFDPEVFKQFEAETGIAVNYASYDDPDELEARLKSEQGSYDVVVADSTSTDRLGELRLIRRLDKSLVPNIANIDESYLNRKFDPKNELSVPYAWGTTLIAVRTDKISDPGAIGTTLYHACVVHDDQGNARLASNAVPLTIVR